MAGVPLSYQDQRSRDLKAQPERPVVSRGSMLPIAYYDENEPTDFGLSWPAMVTEPVNAMARLLGTPESPGTFGQGPDNPEAANDMRTLLLSGYGSNALRGMGSAAGAGAKDAATALYKTARHPFEESVLPALPEDEIWNRWGFSTVDAGSAPKRAPFWVEDDGTMMMNYPSGVDSFGAMSGPNRVANDLFSDTGQPSLLGSALAGEMAQNTPKGIRAFHGSPYDFDRFDSSKIGTGEGEQAFGHGLYFAGDEAVAEHYRKTLGGVDDNLIEIMRKYGLIGGAIGAGGLLQSGEDDAAPFATY